MLNPSYKTEIALTDFLFGKVFKLVLKNCMYTYYIMSKFNLLPFGNLILCIIPVRQRKLTPNFTPTEQKCCNFKSKIKPPQLTFNFAYSYHEPRTATLSKTEQD